MNNNKNKYNFQSTDEWIECFVEQYNKHYTNKMGGRTYNSLRDIGTPMWETIARNCGMRRWSDLVHRANRIQRQKKIFNSHSLQLSKSICDIIRIMDIYNN